MKKLIIFFLFTALAIPVFADGIAEVKQGTEVIAYEIVVTISPEEYKAMTYVAYSPFEWFKNAILNRARQGMDSIVEKHSDKNYKKISIEEKKLIVKEAVIKTAKEKQDEMEAEIKKKGA